MRGGGAVCGSGRNVCADMDGNAERGNKHGGDQYFFAEQGFDRRIASVLIRFGGAGDGKERNVTVKSVVIQ